MRIAVVVPARDVADTIEAALGALARQPARPAWELVVVDNGSSDGTDRIVAQTLAEVSHAGWTRARLVDGSRRRGVSHARNVGVAALGASVDVVAFCDGDDQVAPDWLDAMVGALEHHCLVGGRLDRRRLTTPDRIAPGRELTDDLHRSVAGTRFAVGASLGVHRDLFDRLGGFDEDLVGGLEDADFSLRASRLGVRAEFVPGAIVHYRDRRSSLESVRVARRYGRLEAALVARHPELERAWLRDDILRHAVGTAGDIVRTIGTGAIRSSAQRRRLLRRVARAVGRVEGEVRRRSGAFTRS